MVQCPECRQDIDYLICCETRDKWSKASMEKGVIIYSAEGEIVYEDAAFFCPRCGCQLGTSDSDVLDFLSGSAAPRVDRGEKA